MRGRLRRRFSLRMTVLLTDEQTQHPVDGDRLRERMRTVLTELAAGDKEISILLTDDTAIRGLNRQYRERDAATDVLAFPQEAEDNFSSHLLGDVVVSVETAQRQAAEHHLSLDEELVLLLIHGLLHLLGYDHETSPEEAERMRAQTWKLFDTVFPGKKPSESCNY